MELYVFRHGIANDVQAGGSDSARNLTKEGRDKVASVARLARRAGVEPSLILSSPYVRAVETARIAAEEFGYSGTSLKTDALVPFGTPKGVWDELRDHADERAILLAGHEPLLSQLVAYLLGAPALRVEMKKATMVRIDMNGGGPVPHGTLRWIITARLAALL
jgi:phosphohistidine phosphatase